MIGIGAVALPLIQSPADAVAEPLKILDNQLLYRPILTPMNQKNVEVDEVSYLNFTVSTVSKCIDEELTSLLMRLLIADLSERLLSPVVHVEPPSVEYSTLK